MANSPASRRALAWLVALPLMTAGMVLAHSVTGVVSAARAETGPETVERVSTGSAGDLTMVVGFAVALALVGLGRRVIAQVRFRPSAGLFVVVPPTGFLAAELAERIVHTESFPFHAALEPRLLVGLVLQVPFGLAAFVAARLLLRVVKRVAARLAQRSRRRCAGRSASPIVPISVVLPRIHGIALGYPQRGPPGCW